MKEKVRVVSKGKNIIERTEQWLDERWLIRNMENPPRHADESYYNDAIKVVEFLGYSWKRDKNGIHTLKKL